MKTLKFNPFLVALLLSIVCWHELTFAQSTTPLKTIITPTEGQYNPERTKKIDLIHTKLELKPDWAKQYLYGTATLTVKSHFYEQNILELDAKGFDIQSITMKN